MDAETNPQISTSVLPSLKQPLYSKLFAYESKSKKSKAAFGTSLGTKRDTSMHFTRNQYGDITYVNSMENIDKATRKKSTCFVSIDKQSETLNKP